MIKVRDLEKHFDKCFSKILEDNDIIYIADDIQSAWIDYEKLEKALAFEDTDVDTYLNSVKADFENWIQNSNSKELLKYELDTYMRYFVLEDNKVYYLNNID